MLLAALLFGLEPKNPSDEDKELSEVVKRNPAGGIFPGSEHSVEGDWSYMETI
jgi:hypothetical protein